MTKIGFISLGCSKNLVDSEKLIRQFKEIGYDVYHDSDNVKGEVVIINTCGFIGDAKEESIQTILEMAELKKEGKNYGIWKIWWAICATKLKRKIK